MNDTVIIRRYSETDWEELRRNAESNNHAVYAPSHVCVKGGEIVGYLSIGMIPLVLTWQHTEKVGPTDSLLTLGFVQGTLQNFPYTCLPCDPASPYMRLLPKAGFKKYTKSVELFIGSNALKGE